MAWALWRGWAERTCVPIGARGRVSASEGGPHAADPEKDKVVGSIGSASYAPRGLSMSARLTGLMAGVLVLTLVASPVGALSERERADRISDVAARCESILEGANPNPDEGRRAAADILAKLENGVDDP